MSDQLPSSKQIINGEVKYTLEEFYEYFREKFMSTTFKKEGLKNKEQAFNSIFLFVMLSSEDKAVGTLQQIFNMKKEFVIEGQEAFESDIEIARAIHMRKYLEIYTEYLAGQSMSLRILNLWLKDFLKRHIKEDLDEKP